MSTHHATANPAFAQRLLKIGAGLWFSVAVVGQLAFIVFILAFYGVRTFTGDLAGWNDKALIKGYVEGDHPGNLVFAVHVLGASVVTLAGLIQMAPVLRRRWPALHRWSGRVFLGLGGLLAVSGIWLTVVRETYLSVISAVAILLNGVLVLAFAVLAWRRARQRRYIEHRAWAFRAFMAISGVWFLRVGLMGWILINRGPVGMSRDMSGPTDIVMTFGSYLIPLAVLELYLAAGRGGRGLKLVASTVLLLASAYTAAGVFGTVVLMWGPYLLGGR